MSSLHEFEKEGASSSRPIRRTYGRSANLDGSGDLSVHLPFKASTLVYAHTDEAGTSDISPSTHLHNRWTNIHATWRDSLSELDSTSSSTTETADELAKAMKQLRKGDSSFSKILQPMEPTVDAANTVHLSSELQAGQDSFDSTFLFESPGLGVEPQTPPPLETTAGANNSFIQSHLTILQSSLELVRSCDNDPNVSNSRRSRSIMTSDGEDVDSGLSPITKTERSIKSADKVIFHQDGLETAFEDDLVSSPNQTITLPKTLPKTERIQMNREIAKVLRERPVEHSRPEAKVRPLSDWLKSANAIASSSDSAAKVEIISPSTVSQGTRDDIEPFTPSSVRTVRVGEDSSATQIVFHSTSSPTAHLTNSEVGQNRSVIPATSEDVDDDDTSELGDALNAEDKEDEHEEDMRTTKLQRLQKRKQLALEAKTLRNANYQDDEEDMILLYSGDDQIGLQEIGKPTADPRSIMRKHTAAPQSRQYEHIFRYSGKIGSKKLPVSETYLTTAGKGFAMVDQRKLNAGSKPVGQKRGRDAPISLSQMNATMRAAHQQQVREVARAKEQKYGHSKNLPTKCMTTVDEMTNRSPDSRSTSSNDSDDWTFSDTGVDDDSENDDDAEDETHIPGDRETNSRQSSATEMSDDEQRDEDKENRPPSLSTPRRKDISPCAPISDDEERLRSGPSTNQFQFLNTNDLEGFDHGSPDFSQLFDQTQAPLSVPVEDGLAQMRKSNGGLLPTYALLPGVDISVSQALRDNALIAGEVDDQLPQSSITKQYLNSNGFFTQTRPTGFNETQTSSDQVIVVAPSIQTTFTASATLPIPSTISNTMTSPQSVLVTGVPGTSPTQHDGGLPHEQLRELSEDNEKSHPLTGKINAFDILHDGARRKFNERIAMNAAFIEEQAEESDEDNAWGIATKDDDEDEDLDIGYVPDLLDDTNVAQEERIRLTELATEKHREIERADDAKREAEAKKVTEGYYRQKRRGNDFLSDEEENEGKRRRLSRKQRMALLKDQEDGLHKIGDEANVFMKSYDDDAGSDCDYEESPLSPDFKSPVRLVALSGKERFDMLRERARMNKTDSGAFERIHGVREEDREWQFSIARAKRTFAKATEEGDHRVQRLSKSLPSRSVASYTKFVAEELNNPRRNGVPSGVSVVVGRPGPSNQPGSKAKGQLAPSVNSRQSSSRSILMDKMDRFV